MGRHTKPNCKLCRREGEKLFLKGEKCNTEKCPFSRRPFAPGQHGRRVRRLSEYGIRLREKQKARRIYGLTEKQFESYFDEADRRKGATGEKLLEYLERRLDNVVFRLGFAGSRKLARQMVRHGWFSVNDRKVDIPSYRVVVGEVVKANTKYIPKIKEIQDKNEDHVAPVWVTQSGETEAKVVSIPKREEINVALSDHLIVEYYSR
jgi:small subunit ribosomal protein S4